MRLSVEPALRDQDRDMALFDWLDEGSFNPNYLKRAALILPKRGDKREWKHTQDHWRELEEFAAIDLADEVLVLNVGGSIHMYEAGADGIVDISPFTCMNGIVSEAVYPKVSEDHDNMPIRIFYFDGTEGDYDRDVEIFLELASTYKRRKKKTRRYPAHFSS